MLPEGFAGFSVIWAVVIAYLIIQIVTIHQQSYDVHFLLTFNLAWCIDCSFSRRIVQVQRSE
jgi:hypothetical protein